MTDLHDAFNCPRCHDTYAPHWRAADSTGLCRSCARMRDGHCQWADEHPQHFSEHPCSYGIEAPGEPCRYCTRPVPADGPCPHCWLSFEGLPMADIKAALAEIDLDLAHWPS